VDGIQHLYIICASEVPDGRNAPNAIIILTYKRLVDFNQGWGKDSSIGYILCRGECGRADSNSGNGKTKEQVRSEREGGFEGNSAPGDLYVLKRFNDRDILPIDVDKPGLRSPVVVGGHASCVVKALGVLQAVDIKAELEILVLGLHRALSKEIESTEDLEVNEV
jgi:hypothetical protein